MKAIGIVFHLGQPKIFSGFFNFHLFTLHTDVKFLVAVLQIYIYIYIYIFQKVFINARKTGQNYVNMQETGD